jgi:hypothetical protein
MTLLGAGRRTGMDWVNLAMGRAESVFFGVIHYFLAAVLKHYRSWSSYNKCLVMSSLSDVLINSRNRPSVSPHSNSLSRAGWRAGP